MCEVNVNIVSARYNASPETIREIMFPYWLGAVSSVKLAAMVGESINTVLSLDAK